MEKRESKDKQVEVKDLHVSSDEAGKVQGGMATYGPES